MILSTSVQPYKNLYLLYERRHTKKKQKVESNRGLFNPVCTYICWRNCVAKACLLLLFCLPNYFWEHYGYIYLFVLFKLSRGRLWTSHQLEEEQTTCFSLSKSERIVNLTIFASSPPLQEPGEIHYSLLIRKVEGRHEGDFLRSSSFLWFLAMQTVSESLITFGNFSFCLIYFYSFCVGHRGLGKNEMLLKGKYLRRPESHNTQWNRFKMCSGTDGLTFDSFIHDCLLLFILETSNLQYFFFFLRPPPPFSTRITGCSDI